MTSIFRKLAGVLAVMACVLVPSKAYSWDWCDNNWNCCDNSYYSSDCCPDDCCCGPLGEGRWSVVVKGGVTPTHWTHTPTIWVVNPSLLSPVVRVGHAPKFRDIFDLPWQVGAEIDYNLSCKAQLFIEGNYLAADGKRHSFEWFDGRTGHARHDEFQAWNAYLGARYYFDRSWLCNRVAPFVGFKAGFINHKQVKRSLTLDDVEVDNGVFHHGRSGVSAGLQIGFDVQVWDCVFAVLNFEFVASQPHRSNPNLTLDSPVLAGGPTNVIVGPLGTEISFPITLGLRYEF